MIRLRHYAFFYTLTLSVTVHTAHLAGMEYTATNLEAPIYSQELKYFNVDVNARLLCKYMLKKNDTVDGFKDLARASVDRSPEDTLYLQCLHRAHENNYKPATLLLAQAFLNGDSSIQETLYDPFTHDDDTSDIYTCDTISQSTSTGSILLLEASTPFPHTSGKMYVYTPALDAIIEHMYDQGIAPDTRARMLATVLNAIYKGQTHYIPIIKRLALEHQDWVALKYLVEYRDTNITPDMITASREHWAKKNKFPLSHEQAYDFVRDIITHDIQVHSPSCVSILLEHARKSVPEALLLSAQLHDTKQYAFKQNKEKSFELLSAFCKRKNQFTPEECVMILSLLDNMAHDMFGKEQLLILAKVHTCLLYNKTHSAYYQHLERCQSAIVRVCSSYFSKDATGEEITGYLSTLEQLFDELLMHACTDEILESTKNSIKKYYVEWHPQTQPAKNKLTHRIEMIVKLLALNSKHTLFKHAYHIERIELELACFLMHRKEEGDWQRAYNLLHNYKEHLQAPFSSELYATSAYAYTLLIFDQHTQQPDNDIDSKSPTDSDIPAKEEAFAILKNVATSSFKGAACLAQQQLTRCYFGALHDPHDISEKSVESLVCQGVVYLDLLMNTCKPENNLINVSSTIGIETSIILEEAKRLHRKTLPLRFKYTTCSSDDAKKYIDNHPYFFDREYANFFMGMAQYKEGIYEGEYTKNNQPKWIVYGLLVNLARARQLEAQEKNIDKKELPELYQECSDLYTSLISQLSLINNQSEKYQSETSYIFFFIEELMKCSLMSRCISIEKLHELMVVALTRSTPLEHKLIDRLLELLDKSLCAQETNAVKKEKHSKLIVTSGIYKILVEKNLNYPEDLTIKRALINLHIRRATHDMMFLKKDMHLYIASELVKKVIEQEEKTALDMLEANIHIAGIQNNFEKLAVLSKQKLETDPENLELQLVFALTSFKFALEQKKGVEAQKKFIDTVQKIADKGELNSILIMIGAHLTEEFLPYFYITLSDPDSKCIQPLSCLTDIKKDNDYAWRYIHKATDAQLGEGILFIYLILIYHQEKFGKYGGIHKGITTLQSIKNTPIDSEKLLEKLVSKGSAESIKAGLILSNSLATDPQLSADAHVHLYSAYFMHLQRTGIDQIEKQLLTFFQKLLQQDDETIFKYLVKLNTDLNTGIFKDLPEPYKTNTHDLKEALQMVMNVGTKKPSIFIINMRERNILEHIILQNNTLYLSTYISMALAFITTHHAIETADEKHDEKQMEVVDTWFSSTIEVIRKNYPSEPFYVSAAQKLDNILIDLLKRMISEKIQATKKSIKKQNLASKLNQSDKQKKLRELLQQKRKELEVIIKKES